jgi:hypothetical protein
MGSYFSTRVLTTNIFLTPNQIKIGEMYLILYQRIVLKWFARFVLNLSLKAKSLQDNLMFLGITRTLTLNICLKVIRMLRFDWVTSV